MSRGRFSFDPEARAYAEMLLAKLARPGMCNAADPLPTVDGEPDACAAAGDTRTTAQRNHDAIEAAMRALLASGDLGKHRLPVTAIVTMPLKELEAGSGLALTGGGSTVPMEVAIRIAAHAHHYLYIYDEKCGRPLFLGRSQRLASPDQRIVLHATNRSGIPQELPTALTMLRSRGAPGSRRDRSSPASDSWLPCAALVPGDPHRTEGIAWWWALRGAVLAHFSLPC
jgi:hypothetical protein